MRRLSSTSRLSITALSAVLAGGLVSACSSSGSSAGGADAQSSVSSAVGASGGATGSLHSLIPASLRTTSSIAVAAVSDYPPLSSANNGNNKDIVGFNIDLLNAAANLLGVKFAYTDTSYDSLIPSLKSGRALIAEGGATDDAAAVKATNMVDYLKVGAQVTIPTSTSGINGFSDLCGKKIASLAGTPEYVNDLQSVSKKNCAGKSPIGISLFPTEDQAMLAVKSGRADAAYFSEVGNIFRIQQGLKFKAIGDVLEDAPISFQVGKDQLPLAKALKGAIDELIKNGRYASLVKKYGFPQSSLLTESAINSAAQG